MSDKKNKHNRQAEQAQEPATEKYDIDDVLDDSADETAADTSILAENARLQEELTAAREEIEKEKKEYLFLMADMENLRKRTLREKADLLKNASERVLQGILPIVDDFERSLAAASSSTDAEAIRQGVEMIYNKLVKFLESQGVKAMDTDGQPFDPDFHEAIATIPAPSDDLKGKIVDTTQKGYMLNDKVLRHAKVAVGQ